MKEEIFLNLIGDNFSNLNSMIKNIKLILKKILENSYKYLKNCLLIQKNIFDEENKTIMIIKILIILW